MNTTENDLKEIVRKKYSEIALQNKDVNQSSCCGSGCCSDEVYNIMSEDYSALQGYNADADLGLGCGLPTQFAKIKKGDVVIDLGSGAGTDCFIARVLNLVPNKDSVFKEIFRTLKPGGHFSISDIVLVGTLPVKIREAAEMYAGCVAGAIQKEIYMELIELNKFKNITIQKEKAIIVPDDILRSYLSDEEISEFKKSGTGIFSITVFAEKATEDCCTPVCCSN
jgi:arsenite methyltransferase